MRKTYVIADSKCRMYSSCYPLGLGLYANELHPIMARKVKDAQKYHVLKIANRVARKLSSRSYGYFYVFEVTEVDGRFECKIVDQHLNDDIIENDEKTQERINSIISDWKAEKCNKE